MRMSDIALALSEIEQLRKSLRAVEGKQVFSKGPLEALHRLAGLYYGKVRNVRAADSENAKRADVLFTELHELSRKHPSKQKCLDVLTEAKQVLIKLGRRVYHSESRTCSG